MRGRVAVVVALMIATLAQYASVVAEHGDAEEAFEETWQRTDLPVLSDLAQRTWIWGPEPVSDIIHEPYEEAQGGERSVQYYDKSRMEVTDPNADRNDVWYVTNGLLVTELMTGEMQVGDDAFVDRTPAEINVAGDVNDVFGPTYVTMAVVRDEPPSPIGTPINQRLSRSGAITVDVALSGQGIDVATVTPQTGHAIAAPFWDFMNSNGMVFANAQFADGPMFENPYFATGFPMTEPYWADVVVGGVSKLVLLQCFQRRCLTYTADNEPEWRVEAGNVGLHYRSWRYDPANDPVDGATLPDCDPGDGADFAGQRFVQPMFNSGSLACADFAGAVINQGDFTGANLALADFSGAELRQPIFRSAFMDSIVFEQAELTQPVFNGSSVARANFSNATLSQPIFSGVSLVGADFTATSIRMPRFSNTICPDSTNSDDNNGTCMGHLAPIQNPVP